MRLKRLTLQGYKTFATKTEFVFDGGITAVIGPNGSGKSNIADAMKSPGEHTVRAKTSTC
jgi:chromosome segregation protein